MSLTRKYWIPAGCSLFFLFFCLALIPRQGLWTDEVFSLAMATGHSLEHPASAAVPASGDFVQPKLAVSPEDFRRYIAHRSPPASMTDVSRAVFLSDTNPPLYYWILHLWTRFWGTGDAALRLLSLFFALATIPFLWMLAGSWAGDRVANLSILLYSISPVAILFATDARMYSLLWFLCTLCVWLGVRLHRTGWSRWTAIGWVLTGAAGLLTHYFFLFPWGALSLWSLFSPGSLTRGRWLLLIGSAWVLAGPWYMLLPQSLENWRITRDWLQGPLPVHRAVFSPFSLVWGLLSPATPWEHLFWAEWVAGLTIAFILLYSIFRWRRSKRVLPEVSVRDGSLASIWPWVWLGAVCLSPAIYDSMMESHTSSITRYAIAGLPVILVILSTMLSRMTIVLQAVCLVLLMGSYLGGLWKVYFAPDRFNSPFREVAAGMSAVLQKEDVLLIHSIPSAVIGVSRYLDETVRVACWVDPLGEKRVPGDIEPLLRESRRLVVLRVHKMGGEREPEIDWLKSNATLIEARGGRGFHSLTFEQSRSKSEDPSHEKNIQDSGFTDLCLHQFLGSRAGDGSSFYGSGPPWVRPVLHVY